MNLFDNDNMQDIISSQYLYKGFDKEDYQKVLDGLTPEHLCIYLLTQDETKFESQELLKEKIYGTEFLKTKFSEALLHKLHNPDVVIDEHHKLSNPIPNTFFPENLDVLPENAVDSQTVRLIHSDEISDVWFKKSDKFKVPKIFVHSMFYTNDSGVCINVEGAVFMTLWQMVSSSAFFSLSLFEFSAVFSNIRIFALQANFEFRS